MLVEGLEPDGAEPVADGERCELVATSLFNRTTPLIRYRSDDIVRLTHVPCACGRTHARVWPVGRKGDEVVVDGKAVLPIDVWAAVESVEACAMGLFQVIRTRPRGRQAAAAGGLCAGVRIEAGERARRRARRRRDRDSGSSPMSSWCRTPRSPGSVRRTRSHGSRRGDVRPTSSGGSAATRRPTAGSRGRSPTPRSHRDIADATGTLGALGIGAGSRVLWCSMLSEAGQFWPLTVGADAHGRASSPAPMRARATPGASTCSSGASSTEPCSAVTGAILDGLDRRGRDYREVFGAISVLGARPDAYARLVDAGLAAAPLRPVRAGGRDRARTGCTGCRERRRVGPRRPIRRAGGRHESPAACARRSCAPRPPCRPSDTTAGSFRRPPSGRTVPEEGAG